MYDDVDDDDDDDGGDGSFGVGVGVNVVAEFAAALRIRWQLIVCARHCSIISPLSLGFFDTVWCLNSNSTGVWSVPDDADDDDDVGGGIDDDPPTSSDILELKNKVVD